MPNPVHGIVVMHETAGASLVDAQSEGRMGPTVHGATTRVAPRWGIWMPLTGIVGLSGLLIVPSRAEKQPVVSEG